MTAAMREPMTREEYRAWLDRWCRAGLHERTPQNTIRPGRGGRTCGGCYRERLAWLRRHGLTAK